MGMYDTVIVGCPKCGTPHDLQTKTGDCTLSTYDIYNAPPEVLAGIAGEEVLCENCGTLFMVQVTTMAQTVII